MRVGRLKNVRISFFVELVYFVPADLPVAIDVHHIDELPGQLLGSIRALELFPAFENVFEEASQLLLLQELILVFVVFVEVFDKGSFDIVL